MNKEQFLSIGRSLSKILGAILVEQGLVSANNVETMIGSIGILLGLFASWFYHSKNGKQ